MADTVLFMVSVAGIPVKLVTDRDVPRGGVLMISGQRATGFTSHARAQGAIKRTRRYAEAKGYPWPILDRKKVRIFRIHINA